MDVIEYIKMHFKNVKIPENLNCEKIHTEKTM